MEELTAKVNKGDYYVPITLSKETISFLNCMLQFDRMKRLNIDKLSNHQFLKKNVNEFKKIDLIELKDIKIVDDSKILINTKENSNIFNYFGKGVEE
jgi:serine/threonine protein kinase